MHNCDLKRSRPRTLLIPGGLTAVLAALFMLAAAPGEVGANQPDGMNIVVREAPKKSAPQITLWVASASVKQGQTARLVITNHTQKAYRYYFKGGGSSCVLPIYKITVTTPRGKKYLTYNSGPRRACLAVIVPGRWIVLQPKQSMSLKLHTGRVLHRPSRSGKPARSRQSRFSMTPGTYTVQVQGGGLNLSTKLRVTR